ncbi:geranylgeranylglycerol-phosphate geranylgeranyltransferase [Polaribacter cellanae]|uniref:Geranylgeranylglycerol-phosphate geranylgeranyltransferase n=1 Tax=Polaribacter cellanae TaxID=2818493 RepID=A0A975H7R0_9FLAO|nr:geranylgeranylglycerol-phosphate geranylgeranyltransferase [Polaribacter cellanae]QTE23234.1 geranylgeranylglycerol-phosphate geranylgeranyltransferase [Polaribacter cellanae]
MIAFLKLIRYKNLLMVLLTMVLTKYAFIHSFIKNSYLSNLEFIFLTLSVLLITAGGYIINDIFDIEADKINKPNKVFVTTIISTKKAWNSYFLLNSLGFLLAIYVSISKPLYVFISIFFITIFGLFLYSKVLKKKLLIGNFIISCFIALVIYIIYLYDFKYIEFWQLTQKEQTNSILFLQIWVPVISYSFFAFLTTLIREIIKDIEDVDGDIKIKAKTLPILFGRKRASKVAFFFCCILLVFLLIVLQFIKSETIFLIYGIVFILLPFLYFMYLLIKAEKKKDFSKLSNLMKGIMLFGILSMLLFTIT